MKKKTKDYENIFVKHNQSSFGFFKERKGKVFD